jgi:hypothetical protein
MTTVGISSANLADAFLNIIRGTNVTAPTTINIKLHISAGDPGAAGAGNAAAGDTTRKAATFAAPSGTTTRSIALSANVGPWTNVSTTETLGYISAWSDPSAGNFLWSAQLSANQAWVNTNTFTLTTLGVSITPVAT